jgi:hypothetical protein
MIRLSDPFIILFDELYPGEFHAPPRPLPE